MFHRHDALPRHARKGSEKTSPMIRYDRKYFSSQRRDWTYWIAVAGTAWFFFSIFPLWRYFSNPGHGPRAVQHAEVVTKTVPVTPMQKTAVPNSLAYTTFDPSRLSDAVNAFAHYKQTENCSFSSLDLHGPFEPLCTERQELLDAMSGGGRLGMEQPYSPLGCDMRWFTGEEICEIMSRFSTVYVLGDSLMRNIAVAFQVFLRQDLVRGGYTSWVEDPEDLDCTCAGVWENTKCISYSTVSTPVVWREDPQSMICGPEGRGGFEYCPFLKYPIQIDHLEYFMNHISHSPPPKPYAFVVGHGLWNDLEVDKTFAWIDQTVDTIHKAAPYLAEPGAYFPKLFVGPNAAGLRKPDIFMARQGNIAIGRFEKAVAPFVRDRGFDFLGSWNATIQTTGGPDGTHGGMKNNLLRAMMVLNWLNTLDTRSWHD